MRVSEYEVHLTCVFVCDVDSRNDCPPPGSISLK